MMYKACLTSLSTFTLASAFIGVPTPRHADVVPVERLALLRTTTTSLSALIYGWEGDDDSDGPTKTYSDSSESESFGQCTPHGAAVAESLSYDQKRVGSLARLAVAFSPPERALSLDAIEKVEVICVGQDHIDIQAIICEDGGCITLAVPIKFPYSCGLTPEWLEGCVMRNLEELDESASSTLNKNSKADDGQDDLCLLDASDVDFPSWWVPPGCDEAMATECANMRSILNENEFKSDIIALAQDSLNHAGEGYAVKEAKVAAIGPAGLCFKVRAVAAREPQNPMHVLNVLYPFGVNLQDSEALRATVLGAVATAEGSPER